MENTITAEVFVLVDSDGDYIASHDQDQLKDLYEEHIQELPAGTRVVRLEVVIPLPNPITLTGSVPEVSTEGLELVSAE